MNSITLHFSNTPIRFVTDESGRWMADYRAISLVLCYSKDTYHSALLRLKNTIPAGDRQINHPTHGDLISLDGLSHMLDRLELGRAFDPARADAANALRQWLVDVPAMLADSASDNLMDSTEKGSAGYAGYFLPYGECKDISSPDAGKIEKYHCNDDSNIDSNNGKSPNGCWEKNSTPRSDKNIPQTPHSPHEDDLAYPYHWEGAARTTQFMATILFRLWHQTIGTGRYTSAEVIERAAQLPVLTSVLLEIAYQRRDPEAVCPRRLGKWLKKREGWTDGVLRFISSRETNRKIALWSVRKVAP